LKGFDEAVLI